MPLSLSDASLPTYREQGWGNQAFYSKIQHEVKTDCSTSERFLYPFITTFLKTEQEEINEGIQRCSYSVAVTWLELEGLGFVKH